MTALAPSYAGKRVLLTGDSHMEWSQFGSRLAAKLRERGATVVNLSVGGSSARSWASGGQVCRPGASTGCLSIAALRAQGPYDLALISLGTNDAANAAVTGGDLSAAARRTAQHVQQLVQQIGARETWIVGPPRISRTTGHYTDATMAPVSEALKSTFGSHFIDSRAVPRMDGDGIHVGAQGGEAWAQYVIERMASGGSYLPPAPVLLGGSLLIVGALGALWWFTGRKERVRRAEGRAS